MLVRLSPCHFALFLKLMDVSTSSATVFCWRIVERYFMACSLGGKGNFRKLILFLTQACCMSVAHKSRVVSFKVFSNFKLENLWAHHNFRDAFITFYLPLHFGAKHMPMKRKNVSSKYWRENFINDAVCSSCAITRIWLKNFFNIHSDSLKMEDVNSNNYLMWLSFVHV